MRSARLIVTVLIASVLLTACFTGKRAHFASGSSGTTLAPVSDPAIQAVVAKLETPNPDQFTATYDVTIRLGNTTTTAAVSQMGPTNRSITVGHVRFLVQANTAQTCELSTGVCVPELQDQQISDTQLSHDFYSASPALRLRHDVDTMISPAVASNSVVAGQNTTCVEVHYAAGNKNYCALDNGLLAMQDTPDVIITLTSYTTGSDGALFATTDATAGAGTTTTVIGP